MKAEEAIKILKQTNKWRRGEGVEMPNPRDIGKAIDFAVEEIELKSQLKSLQDHVNRLTKELEELRKL